MNKVILYARLCADPELRYTPEGTACLKLRVANNRRCKDAKGAAREETTFADVTFWARTAEIVGQYCRKGSSLLIEARLKTEEWEKDGKKHSKLVLVAENVTLTGKKDQADVQ